MQKNGCSEIFAAAVIYLQINNFANVLKIAVILQMTLFCA